VTGELVPHIEMPRFPKVRLPRLYWRAANFADSRHHEKPLAPFFAVSGYYSNRGTDGEIPGKI
jgi:hypothetical protein